MARSLFRTLSALAALLACAGLEAGDLKIHVINVGWGSSVLLESPSGKRVLLEAGHTNRAQNVVTYLQSTANVPAGGIDYVVLGHNHTDHGGGLPAVWSAGFIASSPKCYYNGSTNNGSLVQSWFAGAGQMPTVVSPSATKPLIDLGDGTQIWCIASDGQNLSSGSTTNQSSDENDNSMGLVVKYGGFTYLWTSDMGGFELDGCSGRSSAQADIETPMIQAAIAAGVLKSGGVDVLEIGHHGSESSSNPDYIKAAHPSVCVISTGRGQSSGWDLPRVAVVDNILLGSCGFSPAPLVLQTEDGDRNDQGKRSTSAYAVGNVVIDTDGSQFWVSANGDPSTINIADSSTVANERAGAGLTGTADSRGRAFAVKGTSTPPPTPSFTLAVNPTSLTLNQGSSATAQVTLTPVNGFTGTVSLALNPAVSGVTASFSPSTLTTSGTSTLTLSALSSAAATTTATTVTGTSGGLGANAPLGVTVAAVTSTTFNEVEPNNTLSTANVVPATATSLVGYFPSSTDNDDWYKLTLPAGHTLAANMTGPTASQQDYDLYLTNPTGTVLASSTGSTTTESLIYKNTATTAKTVYLHVSRYASYSRVTPYTITLSR
jgi:beta-lactamase superfamily II metal-dependent hydrolase